MSTETIRFIRDGEKGGGGMEVGEEGDYIPIAIHCHHQNVSCIKMGSDESHFNVSLIVKHKVTTIQCPQTTLTFEEKGEPKRIRTEVLLLVTSLTPYRPRDSLCREALIMHLKRANFQALLIFHS